MSISRNRSWIFVVLLALGALAGCGGPRYIVLGTPPRMAPPRPATEVVEVDRSWRQAAEVPHVSVFYDALAPFGVWEEDPTLGWTWMPSDLTFEPYARGRWVETEAGPTFLAEEPYGWAVAHYGRWIFRESAPRREGTNAQGRWQWVPGTKWGPAWVAWRVSNEHVGWRALPPDAWTRPLPDHAWRFVLAKELLGPTITGRTYGLRDVPWLVASSRPHEREAPGEKSDSFVVGPEVRYAGWRARRIQLGHLPAAQLRWVPRWERNEVRPHPRSVRVGPASPERRARKALAVPPPRYDR